MENEEVNTNPDEVLETTEDIVETDAEVETTEEVESEEAEVAAVEAEATEPVTTKVVDAEGKEQVSLAKGQAAFVGVENGLDTQYGLFKKNVPVQVSKETAKYLKATFGNKFMFG